MKISQEYFWPGYNLNSGLSRLQWMLISERVGRIENLKCSQFILICCQNMHTVDFILIMSFIGKCFNSLMLSFAVMFWFFLLFINCRVCIHSQAQTLKLHLLLQMTVSSLQGCFNLKIGMEGGGGNQLLKQVYFLGQPLAMLLWIAEQWLYSTLKCIYVQLLIYSSIRSC